MILFAASLHCLAQQQSLKGRVLDAQTGKPLSKAGVFIEGRSCLAITNDSGYFTLTCKLPADTAFVIEASYVGYASYFVTRQNIRLPQTKDLILMLKPEVNNLDTVTFLPEPLKDVFFGSNNKEVVDYVFVNNSWLIGLYHPDTRIYSLLLLSRSKKIIYTGVFPSKLKSLYISCTNRYYALAGEKVYEITFSNTGINFTSINASYFYKAIRYYVGHHDPYFYITGFSMDQMKQGFYIENTTTKIIEQIPFTAVPREYERKQLYNSYKREKTMKGNSAWPLRRDPSNDLDKYYDITPEIFAEQAFRKLFFEAEYSPFFVCDSNLVLVNYPQNVIEKYHFDATFIDTISLKLKIEPTTIKTTHYDAVSKNIYIIVLNNSNSFEVYELNVSQGTHQLVHLIKGKNIAQLRIRDQYIYYISAPEISKFSYLFREKIIN